ncbi:protein DMP10-like [Pistacia vera]|uniref:protein DMP10-like n=1 Tax=Pistacia vera TaxID=55513 RepID=UPI001263215E|nr:protein DMP10-like [Pistacia vera]
MPKSESKPLATAANLANLLPTGTVLAFQALAPSFSNNGSCLPANRYLTLSIIVACAFVCFFSSLTDSFIDDNGKLSYGIATFKGFYIFNKDDRDENDVEKADAAGKECHKHEDAAGKECNKNEDTADKECNKNEYKPSNYKIHPKDFVHAFASLLVFLVFATSSTDVQRCFFPHAGANGNTLMMNLPLAVGAFASFLFTIFPTKRRGIGYADKQAYKSPKCGYADKQAHKCPKCKSCLHDG